MFGHNKCSSKYRGVEVAGSAIASIGGEMICPARKKDQEEQIDEMIRSALDIGREVECLSLDDEVCSAKIGGVEEVCSAIASDGGEEICPARKKDQEENIEEKARLALDMGIEVECSSLDIGWGGVCSARIGGGEVVCSVSVGKGTRHGEEKAENRMKTTIGSILANSGLIKSTKKRRIEKIENHASKFRKLRNYGERRVWGWKKFGKSSKKTKILTKIRK